MNTFADHHQRYRSHILTPQTLTIITDTDPIQVNAGDSIYDAAVDYIRRGDFPEVIRLLDTKSRIADYARGEFRFVGGEIRLLKGDDKLPPVLGARMVQFMDAGADYKPLLAFWHRLKNNPDKRIVEQAFAFLERNHATFTEDGKLVLYKKVNTDFSAWHKDRQGNPVYWRLGTTVSMPREECDSNANETCSYGLHAAAFGYAATFEGSVLIEAIVDPEDIVAIPKDYDHRKMRCCKAFVRAVNSGQEWQCHVLSDDGKSLDPERPPLSQAESEFLRRKKVEIAPAIDRYVAIPPYALRAVGVGAHEQVTVVKPSLRHKSARIGKADAVTVPEHLADKGTKTFTVQTDARGGCRVRVSVLAELGLADKSSYIVAWEESNVLLLKGK